jgi:hypothetical protein
MPGSMPHVDSSPLISELPDRLRFVERQLEAERQAHAEARRIIGGLVQRIPQLEAPPTSSAPPDAPGPPESGADEAPDPSPRLQVRKRAQSARGGGYGDSPPGCHKQGWTPGSNARGGSDSVRGNDPQAPSA